MNNQSFWVTFKQSLTENGKGSCKRFLAYITTGLVSFLVIHAALKDVQVDMAITLELLGFVAVLLGISAYQQKGISPLTPTVNPDNPDVPKEKG